MGWKLKLKSGHSMKRAHVCCGIGIAKRDKNRPKSFIGWQCQVVDEMKPSAQKYNPRPHKRVTLQASYHCVSGMKGQSCLFNRNIVRLVLDLKAFNLELYVNDSVVPN